MRTDNSRALLKYSSNYNEPSFSIKRSKDNLYHIESNLNLPNVNLQDELIKNKVISKSPFSVRHGNLNDIFDKETKSRSLRETHENSHSKKAIKSPSLKQLVNPPSA